MRFTTLLLIVLLCGCHHQSVDTKAEGEKLMQLSREWSSSVATDSLEKTLSYWADDAVVMSPGDMPIKGKAAIRQMVLGTKKIPGFKISWQPLSVSVAKDGDIAYMIEQNQITIADPAGRPLTEFNKSVTIWRREPDGSWKNVVDMWNTEPHQGK